MDFLHVRLQAADEVLGELEEFYGDRLGVDSYRFGRTQLEFVAAPGEPFYHFAVLVPGNRFDAAFEWIRARVELLPYEETGEEIFDFDNWDALACYFHDPAGNIVELIAHRGVDEQDARGEFDPSELVGFSELGLVGDPKTMARELGQLDLNLWDGELDEPGRLAFVGEKARTLILCPEGRGWLPTGRGAEPHSVDARLSGRSQAEVAIGGHHVEVVVLEPGG